MKLRSIALIAIALVLGPQTAYGNPTFPGTNGKILYGRLDAENVWDLFAIEPDGTDRVRLTSTELAESDAVYSPDGSMIAFTFHARRGSEIYVMNADGTDPVAVTDGPLLKSSPAWAPDGTRLAYQASTDLETDAMVFVIDVGGIGETRLTAQGKINTQATWSPDGTKLAYIHSTHGSSDVFVMNADGSDKTNLTETKTFETFPSWSPDGSEIAYSRYRLRANSNGYDLFAVDLLGDSRPISRIDDFSEQQGRYSPDGSKVAFIGCLGTTCSLEVIDVDGTNRRRLVVDGVEGGAPVWSPDSTTIAFSQIPGKRLQFDLFTVTVGSKEIGRLTDTPRKDEYVTSWQSL